MHWFFGGCRCSYEQVKGLYLLYLLVPVSLLGIYLLYTGTSSVTLTSIVQTLSKVTNASSMSSTVNPVNLTTELVPTPFTQSPEQQQRNFWIGLILAVSSSIFIGTSFVLKKLGLLSVGKKTGGVRAGEGSHQYLKEWKWWSGMTLMMLGEVINFVAYTFAPATLVTPLGALSVLASTVLASLVLKERLNLVGKIGCVLCVIGSTTMVLHSPKSASIQNMEELLDKVKEPPILALVGIMIVIAAVFIIFIDPKYGKDHVIVSIFICSSLGSLTVMGCKGLGVAVTETIGGVNEFTNWLTYVMLGIVIVNILFQLHYLNKALDTFNTSIVTPTYYVVFTSFVILNSLVLFNEFTKMTVFDILGDLCGFLTIVVGIFLMNAFKEMDVSMKNLPKAKKKNFTLTIGQNDFHAAILTHDTANFLEYNENCSLDDEPGLCCDEVPLLFRENELIKKQTPAFSKKVHMNGEINKAFVYDEEKDQNYILGDKEKDEKILGNEAEEMLADEAEVTHF